MTPSEFKTKWVESLRGGDFFQTHNNLFGDAMWDHEGNELDGSEDEDGLLADPSPGHCCLGVGIEVTGGDPDPQGQDGEMPSRAWCAKWGLQYAEAENLASLNDGGNSFDTIADVIDAIDLVPYELYEEGDDA